jgi:hypothetical protein
MHNLFPHCPPEIKTSEMNIVDSDEKYVHAIPSAFQIELFILLCYLNKNNKL